MTEEQIKQAADKYTESLMCENLHMTMYSGVDFIAGAHYALNAEVTVRTDNSQTIANMQAEIKKLNDRIRELDMNLVEQQLENQRLHAAWDEWDTCNPVEGGRYQN